MPFSTLLRVESNISDSRVIHTLVRLPSAESEQRAVDAQVLRRGAILLLDDAGHHARACDREQPCSSSKLTW